MPKIIGDGIQNIGLPPRIDHLWEFDLGKKQIQLSIEFDRVNEKIRVFIDNVLTLTEEYKIFNDENITFNIYGVMCELIIRASYKQLEYDIFLDNVSLSNGEVKDVSLRNMDKRNKARSFIRRSFHIFLLVLVVLTAYLFAIPDVTLLELSIIVAFGIYCLAHLFLILYWIWMDRKLC